MKTVKGERKHAKTSNLRTMPSTDSPVEAFYSLSMRNENCST